MVVVCRFLIQILPAATVAPLFFQGKIEFGVINQSSSAFNHILSDVSLVVYQVHVYTLPQAFEILEQVRISAAGPRMQSQLRCWILTRCAHSDRFRSDASVCLQTGGHCQGLWLVSGS